MGDRSALEAKGAFAREDNNGENALSNASLLEEERPQRIDAATLRPLLAKYNRSASSEDAWGRPFVLERMHEGQQGYIIISLGRDGRRGDCCKKWTDNLDDDAVLSEDGWLQVWYPKPVPYFPWLG
jgi:hypothetical protein